MAIISDLWSFCCILALMQIKTIGSTSGSTIFDRVPCTLGGSRNYKGECRRVQNCPAVLSTLRSGNVPNKCVHVDKEIYVCCETERRISSQKCQEYHEKAQQNAAASSSPSNSKVAPLLPSTFQQRPSRPLIPRPLNRYWSKREVPLLDEEQEGGHLLGFVVGGKKARVGQFPHMVSLGFEGTFSKRLSWLCGGTLISDQFALTAAHCVQHDRGKLTSILVGDVNLQEDPTNVVESRLIIPTDTVIIHPDYKPSSKHNDIALIKLKAKVNLSSSVKPACLPQPKERMELQNALVAHGWGLTEFAGTPSELLLFVELKRYEFQKCKKLYLEESRHEIIPSQFCAASNSSEEAKDTCEGDSGSGLVIKHAMGNFTPHFVLGVTSFGPKFCGFHSTPGVYTNVQSFLDWIEDTVWPYYYGKV